MASQPVHEDGTEEGVLVELMRVCSIAKRTGQFWRRAQQEEHYGAKDNFFSSV